MLQKYLKHIPTWLIGGLIALSIDMLNALRVMQAGWDRVIAPFLSKIDYFIGAGGFFHFFVAFLIGCLAGKIFSSGWQDMSYSKRGMIFGSIFALGGFIFIRSFIELFAESFAVNLFLPLVMAVFGLGMRGSPAGALETLLTLSIATGITTAFYAAIGAWIGKIIYNLKRNK